MTTMTNQRKKKNFDGIFRKKLVRREEEEILSEEEYDPKVTAKANQIDDEES
jgi:hypothetical protein